MEGYKRFKRGKKKKREKEKERIYGMLRKKG
jgi:hypothetical protein